MIGRVIAILGVSFLFLLVLPEIALSQHSASASQTLRFGVLPVYTPSGAVSASFQNAVKVTVSLEPDSGPTGGRPGHAASHMLLTPGSLPVHPPRGSSVILTITE